jgi:hypothetical protein
MSDQMRTDPSALRAWASTVMSGGSGTNEAQVGEVDRAPGRVQYDPADVISIFMSARESAKERHALARRSAPGRRPQPS